MFWFNGNITEAINKSKKEKKVFVVFINGNDVNSQKLNKLYESLSSVLVTKPLVAIKLDSDNENCKLFSQLYPVILIPSTYFIDLNGVAIEIIGGSVDNQNDLLERIEKVIKVFNDNNFGSDQQNSSAIKTKSEALNSPSNSSQINTSVDSEPKPSNSVASNQTKDEKSENVSIDSKVERANQLIEAIRQKKMKEEEEKAKTDEMERIRGMKAMQSAKHLREEKEAQEVIKEREKAKRDERLARERVLAQIAADREERRARQMAFSQSDTQSSSQSPPIESIPGSSAVRNRNHEKTRIQFRLPDGSTRNSVFESSDSLETVRQYITSNSNLRNFVLSTTFPRREFVANDYSQTLEELSLSPSSVLLVIPNSGITGSKALTSPSAFWQLFSLVLSPFVMIWNFISRFFSPSETSGTNTDTSSVRRSAEKKQKSFYNKDGNVARIRDPMRDDDDDSNTWNGNSTQQM